jgi:hypothetical protein
MEKNPSTDRPPTDPDREAPPTDDPRVLEEEAAAAGEAAAIGGEAGGLEETDPALRPVAEGGGGEAEGFERAEEELREHAEHGEGLRHPSRDAMTPEEESDRSGAAYGEPDRIDAPEPDLDRE